MPRLRHYDNLNTVRFITFCCYHRHKLLIAKKPIHIFLDTLFEARRQYRFRLLGHVIMPEHVHIVIHPRDDTRVGALIGEIKSKSAARIITEQAVDLPDSCRVTRAGRERRVFWQPRCYEHNCRSVATVIEKINYCHNNPVRRGWRTSPRSGNGRVTIGIWDGVMCLLRLTNLKECGKRKYRSIPPERRATRPMVFLAERQECMN